MAGVATLLFAAVGVEALGRPLAGPILVRHALLGGGAALLQLLAQGWILVFTLALLRSVRRAGLPLPRPDTAAAGRRLAPWAAAAVVSPFATFLLGGAVVTGEAGARAHAATFALALALQVAALARQWAHLARLRAALESDLGAPVRLGGPGPAGGC